eukprot:246747-Pyramimonas_sp.AAC.2
MTRSMAEARRRSRTCWIGRAGQPPSPASRRRGPSRTAAAGGRRCQARGWRAAVAAAWGRWAGGWPR